MIDDCRTINHDFAVWQCQNRHTGDRVDLGDILLALLKGNDALVVVIQTIELHRHRDAADIWRVISTPKLHVGPQVAALTSGMTSVANKRSESRTC